MAHTAFRQCCGQRSNAEGPCLNCGSPPLFAGGQGRSPEDVSEEGDSACQLVMLGVFILAFVFLAGLLTGHIAF